MNRPTLRHVALVVTGYVHSIRSGRDFFGNCCIHSWMFLHNIIAWHLRLGFGLLLVGLSVTGVMKMLTRLIPSCRF